MQILSNLSVSGLLGLDSVADANTDTDKFLVLDSSGIVRYRTGAELLSDIGGASTNGFVPYAGATANVDLGTHTLSAKDLVINHSSGSGVAASITKGGNGEALTVVKSSGSGNAASITGGVTLLSELHLTTDLADAYIASASNWNDAYNLRHNAVTLGTANGLSLSTQVLSLALASGSTTGALSSTDWSTFNNKQSALTNPVTGTGVSGQVTYFNGTTSVTGNNNFFWDTANNRLGIGLTNPQRRLEIYSATPDSHLRISGSAPSVSLGESITGSIYQAKFGLATASGHYSTSAAAGDFVIISQTGSTIWMTGTSDRLRIDYNGQLRLHTYTSSSSWTGTATAFLAVDSSGNVITTSGGSSQWVTSGSDIYYNTGNVGIGTTSPTYKLDVSGTGRFTSNLTLGSGATLYMTAGDIQFVSNAGYGILTADSNRLISIQNGAFGVNGVATFSSSVTAGGTINQTSSEARLILNRTGGTTFGAGVNYQTSGTNNWIVGTGQTTVGTDYQIYNYGLGSGAIAISYTNNNVGIGTTSPTGKLDVLSTYASDTTTQSVLRDNTGVALNFGGTGSGFKWLQAQDSTGASTFYSLLLNPRGGNVGIGTTAPSSGLSSTETTLQIENGNVAALSLNNTASRKYTIYSGVGGQLAFYDVTSSTERMRITSGGDVGIGLTNPQAILDVSHTAGTTNIIRVSNGSGNYRWRVDQNFAMIMTNASGTDTFSVTTAGALTAVSVTETSTIKVKENIVPVDSVLDQVDKLQAVSYNRKGSSVKEIGLIAEAVEEVYPEFVQYDQSGEPVGINYSRLTAVLIESVKELKNRITELEKRN